MESEAKVQTLAQHGQGITQAVYPQSGQGTQFKLRPPPRTVEVQNDNKYIWSRDQSSQACPNKVKHHY